MAACPQCGASIKRLNLIWWSPKLNYACIKCGTLLTVHEQWNKLAFFLMWLPLIPVTRYGAVWWQDYGVATVLVVPIWFLVLLLATYFHKIIKVPADEA